jgi:hypothetical protein
MAAGAANGTAVAPHPEDRTTASGKANPVPSA